LHKRNIITGLLLAGALVIGGTGGAVAGDLIGSKDIRDGSIKVKDIAPGAVEKFTASAKGERGPVGPVGPVGPKGADGKDGAKGEPGNALVGATYRTMTYTNGGGGSATVACDDDPTVSQTYTAIAGGVQGGNVDTQDDGFVVNSSFPGRMDWDTGTPRPGRLDGWIVLGNGQHTSTLTVWALCVPNTSITVDNGTINN